MTGKNHCELPNSIVALQGLHLLLQLLRRFLWNTIRTGSEEWSDFLEDMEAGGVHWRFSLVFTSFTLDAVKSLECLSGRQSVMRLNGSWWLAQDSMLQHVQGHGQV